MRRTLYTMRTCGKSAIRRLIQVLGSNLDELRPVAINDTEALFRIIDADFIGANSHDRSYQSSKQISPRCCRSHLTISIVKINIRPFEVTPQRFLQLPQAGETGKEWARYASKWRGISYIDQIAKYCHGQKRHADIIIAEAVRKEQPTLSQHLELR